jgi:hypothetical protein
MESYNPIGKMELEEEPGEVPSVEKSSGKPTEEHHHH